MRRLATAALVLSLALSGPAAAGGQEPPSFRARIVDSIRAWLPTWMIVNDGYFPYEEVEKQIPQLAHLKHEVVLYLWEQEASCVMAHIYNHRSLDDVSKTYDWIYTGMGLPKWGAAGPPENPLAKWTGLEGLGDDSYIVGGGEGSTCRLVFRKGKAVVHIEAPSPDIAREFATHISAELPAA